MTTAAASTHNDDDDIQMDKNAFETRLFTLASSKPDIMVPSKRQALMASLMADVQQEDPQCRQWLAEWKDPRCSSLHAYRRVVSLVVTSLNSVITPPNNSSDDDGDVTLPLLRILTRLLELASDARLIQQCGASLLASSSSSSSSPHYLADLLWNQVTSSSSSTTTTMLSVIPAIAVGAVLDDTKPWYQPLLQYSITHLASSKELQLVEGYLRQLPSQQQQQHWNQEIGPALLLKCKSHPDRALDTLKGWMPACDSMIDEDFLSLLIKHLVSTTSIERSRTARDMLVAWASASPSSLGKIVTALATSTKGTANREVVYDNWRLLGRTNHHDADADSMGIVETALSALVAVLPKETKPDLKRLGHVAMIEWILPLDPTTTTIPVVALDYWRAPVVDQKLVEGGGLLGLFVEHMPEPQLQRLLRKLWTKEYEKGLEAMAMAAVSKKALHVEGLLAIYVTLLQYASTHNKLPAFAADVVACGSSTTTQAGSFLYAESMLEAIPTNPLIGVALSRTLALYTRARHDSAASSLLADLFPPSKLTLACKALAACIMNPASTTAVPGQYATPALLASLESIVSVQPTASEALVETLYASVNEVARDVDAMVLELNSSRQARESENEVTIKGQGSASAEHRGYDAGSVRKTARLLSRHGTKNTKQLARVLVLMHVGSSLKSEGHQRAALVLNTLRLLEGVVLPMADHSAVRSALAEELCNLATKQHYHGSGGSVSSRISTSMHEAALSVITSLGGIASNFSRSSDDAEAEDMKPYAFVSGLCIEEIGVRLRDTLDHVCGEVEGLTDDDVDLYLSPAGVLFGTSANSDQTAKKLGGKRLSDDELWEIQMKQELAEKKRSESGLPRQLSEDEKKLLAVQDEKRRSMGDLMIGDFVRTCAAIRSLCSSDIEVGNECLPTFMTSVLTVATSRSPAMLRVRDLNAHCELTLSTLSSCVYEIDEMHAPTLSQALLISYRNGQEVHAQANWEEKPRLVVSALPSPSAPAACVVYEMDQVHDSLSAPSFLFLFPVLRAALMGPRTPPGCEGALRVLERHTSLLAGDTQDPRVCQIRRDMVESVLELLKHDRAQTFHDPTPYEALISCYREGTGKDDKTLGLSSSDLSPLLDERGSLGPKSCRVGSMLTIAHIASRQSRGLRVNPLVENRVWVNCFDADEDIRQNARHAWMILNDSPITGQLDDDVLPKPSPLFAASCLPLLSFRDTSISRSAANALAAGMAKHPGTVARNIEALCKLYIDAFPSALDSDDQDTASLKGAPSVASSSKLASALGTKKAPSTSVLPKKKTSGNASPLVIAGIGKQKAAVKKKVSHSALLKPKAERTLDQAEFESQFSAKRIQTDEEKDSPAKIAVRLGVLHAVASLTQSSLAVDMDEATIKQLTSFLMAYGIAESDNSLRGAARDALRDIVASKGGTDEAVEFLLPHLETVLKTGIADESTLGLLQIDKVPRSVPSSDRRKEGAVAALGSVALHLKGSENDDKIDSTINMLIGALRTPSEDVQHSVAEALAKLMKKGRTQERIDELLKGLLHDCLDGNSLAVQRGAAYGLSAVVKGSGIMTLKKFEIVKQLDEACSTGSSSKKEGSLFAIELLCDRLGLLFEPYVIALLPSLLKSFSDNSDHVRKAAANTVGLIMSKLSAHGVKLVMPAVLQAFDDSSWRTKQASILMLGAMSHLAPKQLASALPKVVPKLTEAFSDTHPKVKASAQEALKEISTVIRNPEVSSISPVLLKALTDPADRTIKALEALIETEFLHAIDAPSLALIVPILHRGLRDRGATSKRYSGLITGNITTMVNDPKDFVPYLSTLLPDLQSCLLDPIPDVRSTAAKALGSLTRSLGDQILPELRPWLLKKLREEGCSSAERSGAAQGLTEVLIASGTSTVEDAVRNELLPLQNYPGASTREGVLWMLTFLPSAMGQGFTSLIDASLPALIAGLSDDSEPVRDVALRAGRVLIRSHGKVHADKILPSLEESLGHPDYRIRVASLSLLGDLLSMIGGTSLVKGDGETQDDIRKAERAQAQISLVLGSATRKRVLSRLFLSRNDSMHAVRQSALQVWKTVVSVTGRTLRDILPELVSKIIDDLASGEEEKVAVAGRCLGDVVSKLGESVLPQIIPVLKNALYDGDTHTKRGVCVGLTEVINGSTREQIMRFIEIIVKVVQAALSDDDKDVRKMAAASFQSLYNVVGSRAMDEVVPSLIVGLENGDDEVARVRAINGLSSILIVRSKELLPYIIPRLLQRPLTIDHAKALSAIASVTATTIYWHFGAIVPVILEELAENQDPESDRAIAIRECRDTLCKTVDTSGVNVLIREIASKSGSDKPGLRRESCVMFEVLISERSDRLDFFDLIPVILRELLYRLNDGDDAVLKASNGALTALSKHVPAEELVKHVDFMRNLLASMISDARRRKGGVGDGEFLLPGFNIPNGLEPLIPIYQRGILYGNPAVREVSAAGLGEIIAVTSSKFLAGPLLIKMTGPLLRIVGDRNPPNVKVAILKTLGLILTKGGVALRAFVPQFQTTFVKALSDPSRQVRIEAIDALSLLMPLTTRVDPLIKELVTAATGSTTLAATTATDDLVAVTAIQTATLEALAVVLDKAGSKAQVPSSVPSTWDIAKSLVLTHDDQGIRQAAAKVLGAACALSSLESVTQLLDELAAGATVGSTSSSSAGAAHGTACAIRRILVAAPVVPSDALVQQVVTLVQDDSLLIRQAGCVALGAIIGRSSNPKTAFATHESLLLKIMQDSSQDLEVHRSVAKGLCVALLLLVDGTKRLDAMGLSLIDGCLKLALSGVQRVQFSYQDVLWLALNVDAGSEGLDRYVNMAVFDNVRAMKSLHAKVLIKMKNVNVD